MIPKSRSVMVTIGVFSSRMAAYSHGRVQSGVPGDRCRQETHKRGRAGTSERSVRPQGVYRNISAVTFVRVHRQVRTGLVRASWREDVVHRAGFTVGERLCGKLLSCCSGTSCWHAKRSTRCLRPRCSSSGGGSTTTRSGHTVPWDTDHRPQSRCSPVRLLRLRLRNRTGLVYWRAKP